MKQKIILHICLLDKFIPPFIDFMEMNFDLNCHVFVLVGDITRFPVQIRSNVIHLNLNSSRQRFFLLARMHLAKKIILHSIFSREIVRTLFYAPWLLAKCYWVIWGGDLYHYQFRPRTISEDRYEKVRAFVIRRIGHLVTQIRGDFLLAQSWYGAKGQYHDSLMYPSNLYKDRHIKPTAHETINILVGNSALPTNNHIEVLEKLSIYKDSNIKIYAPLSYGDHEYAQIVTNYGVNKFGDKFIPLTQFMPLDRYLELLADIDIAIFNHNRQQAMGNTISLLGLGKKVYMRRNVTPWFFLTGLGISVFDVEQLDLIPLDEEESRRNREIVSSYFSEERLIEQLDRLFA